MYNPYTDQYEPDNFTDSPWLRQQQSMTMPSQPYMGGFGATPPIPPTPPSSPMNPGPAINPISQLSRSRSFFNPGPSPTPDSTSPDVAASPDTAPPESPLVTAYKRLLSQPEGAAHAAYTDYLKRGYPVEQPASRWRNLGGAAIAGLGAYARDPNAYEKAKAFVDEPNIKAMQRYGMEGTKLYQAANEEDRQYQNQLKNAAGMVTEERNASLTAHQQRQDEIALANEKRKEAHDKIWEIVHNRTEYEYYKQPGGNVIGINKRDPKDTFDTNVPSNLIDRATEIALNFADNKQLALIRGEEARKTGIAIKSAEGGGTKASADKWTPVSVYNTDRSSPDYGKPEAWLKNEAGDFKRAPSEVGGGSFARPPKDTGEGSETTTTTTTTTPPPAQSGLEKALNEAGQAIGVSTPPEAKSKTVVAKKAVTPPGKKSLSNEGKTKTTVPAAAGSGQGATNVPNTSDNYEVYEYDDGGKKSHIKLRPEDVNDFTHSHTGVKKLSNTIK